MKILDNINPTHVVSICRTWDMLGELDRFLSYILSQVWDNMPLEPLLLFLRVSRQKLKNLNVGNPILPHILKTRGIFKNNGLC